ncbi:hypothetical protein HN51_034576 [Arachis hypogaea]
MNQRQQRPTAPLLKPSQLLSKVGNLSYEDPCGSNPASKSEGDGRTSRRKPGCNSGEEQNLDVPCCCPCCLIRCRLSFLPPRRINAGKALTVNTPSLFF